MAGRVNKYQKHGQPPRRSDGLSLFSVHICYVTTHLRCMGSPTRTNHGRQCKQTPETWAAPHAKESWLFVIRVPLEPKGIQMGPKLTQIERKGTKLNAKGNNIVPKGIQNQHKMHPKIDTRQRSRKRPEKGAGWGF